MRARNPASWLNRSLKWPCFGQSFSIHTAPSRSTMSAGIIPTSPDSPGLRASRASSTQRGQSESVRRGQPNVGRVRSRSRLSGAGAQDGCQGALGNLSSTQRTQDQSARAVPTANLSTRRMVRCAACRFCILPPTIRVHWQISTHDRDEFGQPVTRPMSSGSSRSDRIGLDARPCAPVRAPVTGVVPSWS